MLFRSPGDGATAAELLDSIERQIGRRFGDARHAREDHLAAPARDAATATGGADVATGPSRVGREADRRDSHRHRVLKRGVLILNGGFSTINCIVRDMSIGGAKVAVEGEFNAPKFMELLLVDRNERVATETRWQSGKSLGLKFMPANGG